jgi:hypothetical protein
LSRLIFSEVTLLPTQRKPQRPFSSDLLPFWSFGGIGFKRRGLTFTAVQVISDLWFWFFRNALFALLVGGTS